MSIRYECARCGARYEVEDRFGGTKARCSKCYETNVVPLPRGAAVGAPAAGGGSQGGGGPAAAPLPRDVRRACVECGEDMPSNASVCVHCGYDTRSGRRLVTQAPSVPRASDMRTCSSEVGTGFSPASAAVGMLAAESS